MEVTAVDPDPFPAGSSTTSKRPYKRMVLGRSPCKQQQNQQHQQHNNVFFAASDARLPHAGLLAQDGGPPSRSASSRASAPAFGTGPSEYRSLLACAYCDPAHLKRHNTDGDAKRKHKRRQPHEPQPQPHLNLINGDEQQQHHAHHHNHQKHRHRQQQQQQLTHDGNHHPQHNCCALDSQQHSNHFPRHLNHSLSATAGQGSQLHHQLPPWAGGRSPDTVERMLKRQEQQQQQHQQPEWQRRLAAYRDAKSDFNVHQAGVLSEFDLHRQELTALMPGVRSSCITPSASPRASFPASAADSSAASSLSTSSVTLAEHADPPTDVHSDSDPAMDTDTPPSSTTATPRISIVVIDDASSQVVFASKSATEQDAAVTAGAGAATTAPATTTAATAVTTTILPAVKRRQVQQLAGALDTIPESPTPGTPPSASGAQSTWL